MEYVPGIIVALIAAAASYAAARYSSHSTLKASKEANAVTFSRDLMSRVESLEDDVKELKGKLEQVTLTSTTAINYIERWLLWALGGCQGPMPIIPTRLIPHLDPSLVEEHQRQQSSPKK